MSTPSDNFRFITVTDPKQNDRHTRRQIRSHVMQGLHKTGEASVPRPVRGEAVGTRGRFRLESASSRPVRFLWRNSNASERQVRTKERGRSTLPEPFLSPGLGVSKTDPFSSLPVEVSGHTEFMLQHYMTHGSDCCPVGPQAGWFTYAMTDTALFHATLLHSSIYFTYEKPNNRLNYPEIYEHEAQAIQIINRRLNDAVESTSDHTIAAVTCLAAHQNCFRAPHEINVHMDGLEKMVALRGGIDGLGMKGLLSRLIKWVDQCHATISSSRLRFAPALPEEESVSSTDFAAEVSFNRTPLVQEIAPMYQQTMLEYFRHDIWNVFGGLARVGRYLASTSLNGSVTDDEKKMNRVEHQLIASAIPKAPVGSFGALHPFVYECTRIATVVYLHSIRRKTTPNNNLVSDARVTRIQTVLETDAFFLTTWQAVPEILLWVLFIAAMRAQTLSQRAWFVGRLANLSWTLSIFSWSDLKNALMKVFWAETTGEYQETKLWGEVAVTMMETVDMYGGQ